MTPERAAYHRLMLMAGLDQEYDQELDQALEIMDPIPEPELSLAMCMSDRRETISVLYNYIMEHPADEDQVCQMVWGELRRRYQEAGYGPLEICRGIEQIVRANDFSEPWIELYHYLYEYELYEEGLITRKVFEEAFRSYYEHGIRMDVWSMRKKP